MKCQLKNNQISSYVSIHPNQTPPASFAQTLHPVRLSSSSSAVTFLFGRKILLSSLQQPATFCVCNHPKILPVLLTPSSTRSLPE